MGIWDGLKKAKNYITGGSARLNILLVDQAQLKAAFNVALEIDVDSVEIKADKIYLVLQYTEDIEISVQGMGSRNRGTRTVRKRNTLFEEEIILDKMLILNPNEFYSYDVEIKLPSDAYPAFNGMNAKYIWSLQAFIEKSGNNPNSSLLEITPLYSFK